MNHVTRDPADEQDADQQEHEDTTSGMRALVLLFAGCFAALNISGVIALVRHLLS